MGAQEYKVVGGRFVVRKLFKKGQVWMVRVRDLRTGKMRCRSTRETSKRQAEQAAMAWIEELVANGDGRVRAVGFVDAFEEWLSLKEVRPYTLLQYRRDFEGILMPVFAMKSVHEIDPLDVERFLKAQQAAGKAPRTRQKYLMLLRSFLRWSVRHGYAERDATDGIRSPKIPRRRPRSLSHEEARRLLLACREGTTKSLTNQNGTWTQEFRPPTYLYPVTLTALHTGLRLGNLRRLTWGNVDLDGAMIAIAAEAMKNNMDFVVPLHPELVPVLRELRDGDRNRNAEDSVFDIFETDFRKSWKGAMRRAGLTELRFHEATRKSFASWLATRTSYAVLKALLGHALPDVTGIYVNVPVSELRSVVEGLPKLIDA